MRLLTIIAAIFLLGCNTFNNHLADDAYYDLLSSRLDKVGIDIDSLIYACEQGMIDGKSFSDRSSKNYIQFINRIKSEGDFPTKEWQIDHVPYEALMNLDITYDSVSQLNPLEEMDTNSIIYKGVAIFDEVSSQTDISPTIITNIVLKYINEKDFDRPLYRLLFFNFLARVYDPDINKGLRVQLPDYPEDDFNSTKPINPDLIIEIFVGSGDSIFVNGLPIELNELTNKVKSFLTERPADTTETKKTMSKKIVSLKNYRGTSVTRYVNVYNEIIRAFNEVRDEIAIRKYGMRLKDLDNPSKKIITELVPLLISEAEPIEYNDD